ncbi:RNA polymerase sigma factor [Larkinella arboricola]|uniref:RNA polymerase sigma factor (Sigma-70 family) n=1 Tax=Larkinella arboricola TaxID=643671 RepID=A0A327XC99_LARAB|nr:sigma-70 family RNA polymerase sigma factor [Larkinella arboricola]RAK03252.1 RNA polymerase sigma factor (sigma-70 family) [Larkinella arboricola]
MTNPYRLHLSDDQLLAGLANGSDTVLEELYRRYFPMVLHLILNNNGSEDDAKDVYQETLIVLYEKVTTDSLALHCQLKTYLYSVSRRLWLKQLSLRNRNGISLMDTEDVASVDDDLINHEARDRQFELMAESLDRLGEPCRTLLEDFYMRHLSMQDITEKFGYTNADNAKTQKYKCLMRLKRLFFAVFKEE